jgi:cytochrome P450
MKTPAALDHVRSEADKQAGSAFVTRREANAMPYLQAAIKEGVRLHPPAGLMLERHVPPEGVELGGCYFPGRTVVGVNPWVTTRNTEVYGDDIEGFRPERWLQADPEQRKAMERANFTFGAGARSCIGQNISMLESRRSSHSFCAGTSSSFQVLPMNGG